MLTNEPYCKVLPKCYHMSQKKKKGGLCL